MISIPVSLTTHTRLARLSKWLCIVAFIVVGCVLGASGLSGWLKARAILQDHSVTTASVTLDDVEEKRGRKGRVSYTYHFSYNFEAAGKQQVGRFSTSESNASPFMADGATVKVAYSNREPSRFERLDRLESRSGLGSVLKRWMIALVFSAILALVAHLIITRRLFVVHAPGPVQAT